MAKNNIGEFSRDCDRYIEGISGQLVFNISNLSGVEKAKDIREGRDTLPTSMSEVAPESERYTALAGIAKSEKDLEFTVELLKEANRIDDVVGKTAGKLNKFNYLICKKI